MSVEATGDGKPAVVDEVQPAAASESMKTDDACMTSEPAGSGQATEPGDNDEASVDDDSDVDAGTGADDGIPQDDGAQDDEVTAPDEHDYEADDAEDEDEPDSLSLVELAEPVEFDESVTALPPVRRWPRVLLAVGFVVIAAAIVGGAIGIVGSVTHGFKKPVKVTYKKSALFSLRTGDCFDPQGQSYTLVSCDSPHVAEVFATFALAGDKWPGSTAVAAAASSGCASRLTDYLNPQLALSLASTYVYPDSTAWQAGTRTVVCEVRASSGDLTGSVRGASATAG